LKDELALAKKKKNTKRREQKKPNALDEARFEIQRSKNEYWDHDVLQPNANLND
jgi:hypothetical protein